MRTLFGTILMATDAAASCTDAKAGQSVVQPCPGYNSWTMVQSVGGRLVCAYSRGSAHTVNDGRRGVFARVSEDSGATWSDEDFVFDHPMEWPEPTILFEGKEERDHDAGNVTAIGGRHFLSLYTGTKTNTAVLVVEGGRQRDAPMQKHAGVRVQGV